MEQLGISENLMNKAKHDRKAYTSNQRSFAEMEKAAEKLLKDAKTFSEAVTCTSYA